MRRLTEAEKSTIQKYVSILKDVVQTNNAETTYKTWKKSLNKTLKNYNSNCMQLKKAGVPVENIRNKVSATYSDIDPEDLSITAVFKNMCNWISEFKLTDLFTKKFDRGLLIAFCSMIMVTIVGLIVGGIDFKTMVITSVPRAIITIGILGPLCEEVAKWFSMKYDSQRGFWTWFNAIEFTRYIVGFGLVGLFGGTMSFASFSLYVVARICGVMLHTLTMRIQNNPNPEYSGTFKFLSGWAVHAIWNTVCIIIALEGQGENMFLLGGVSLGMITLLSTIMNKILNRKASSSEDPIPATA